MKAVGTLTSQPQQAHAPGQTLAGALSSHDNAFGFLRLLLALLVIVDHAFPLGGFGEDPMWGWSRQQESFGGLAVAGFFAISGYLITKSGANNDWLQFLWRRGLRIMPAYWAVLLVAALVVGPVVWKLEHLGLRTYFTTNPLGPLAYFTQNFLLSGSRYCIYDIFAANTPYGLRTKGSVFNGSLWTLIYEWNCYLLVMALAFFGVFRRARPAVLVLAVGLLVMTNLQLVDKDLPGKLLPALSDVFTTRFTCIFIFGSLAAIYAREIPLDDRLGFLALAISAFTLTRGGYYLLGYPALAYALLWLAARLPAALRKIGAKNDYSYGIYLYGFLVQQTLAYAGVHKLGLIPYIAASMLVSAACAMASWHLLEKRAMRFKDRGPGLGVDGVLGLFRGRRADAGAPLPLIDISKEGSHV